MTQAAKHLSMSQPVISEAIATLESTLRVKLLDRSPSGVAPTIYANALLKRGVAVFDELLQGIRDIEFLADPAAGEVRVGCPETLTAGLLPEVIERFSRKYPNVSVHVSDVQATEQFRELRERNIDLMLATISPSDADDDIDAGVLYHDEHFVVSGKQSAWARRRKIVLAELANEHWILQPQGNFVRTLIEEVFRRHDLEAPKAMVTSVSIQLRMRLLDSGNFLSILSGSVLRQNIERWSLKVLPIDLGLRRTISVVTLKNRTLSPVVQRFIEEARAVAMSMFPPARAHKKS
jgi:DNA-binding transcriptional LysR family regulator